MSPPSHLPPQPIRLDCHRAPVWVPWVKFKFRNVSPSHPHQSDISNGFFFPFCFRKIWSFAKYILAMTIQNDLRSHSKILGSALMTQEVFIESQCQGQLKGDPERHTGGAENCPCPGEAYNEFRERRKLPPASLPPAAAFANSSRLNNHT